ncbi:uncharacterized protein EDB93DRAFT_70126 [Suillus bovinus]|uniref:uncharacterized protein n=1 Tax=Suillus bovinus TaxID=48563 RepID=UPI001B86FA87|nr:uncharacterized protein EDB93DRAFT_70126 [Suillus bovinus]KAG2130766.1 hypothetical protein EDB93DRAFT_70126 [Suillus bovinus]
METEYSLNDIAAGKSLQILAYIYTSMATFWAYEYFCSFQHEWTFLHRSRWTKVKCLYILTRYVPFLLLLVNLYTCFSPNENSGICSQSFFVLRTCALWNNNRIVILTMLSLCLAFITASISIALVTTATAPFATSNIPGITGCYQVMSNIQLFIPFLFYFALALGLMALTLVRAIMSWRTTKSHLYVVLLKHNISYYACGLLFSVANIFTSLLLHYAYHAMLHDLQFIILAILATSMHRHLWQMDLHTHIPDPNARMTLSDMLPADNMTEYHLPWSEV